MTNQTTSPPATPPNNLTTDPAIVTLALHVLSPAEVAVIRFQIQEGRAHITLNPRHLDETTSVTAEEHVSGEAYADDLQTSYHSFTWSAHWALLEGGRRGEHIAKPSGRYLLVVDVSEELNRGTSIREWSSLDFAQIERPAARRSPRVASEVLIQGPLRLRCHPTAEHRSWSIIDLTGESDDPASVPQMALRQRIDLFVTKLQEYPWPGARFLKSFRDIFDETYTRDHPTGTCTDICEELLEALIQKAGAFGSSRDFPPAWKAAMRAALHSGIETTADLVRQRSQTLQMQALLAAFSRASDLNVLAGATSLQAAMANVAVR